HLRPLAERRKAAVKADRAAHKAGQAAPAPAGGALSEDTLPAAEPVHPAAFEGLNARAESETIQVG
ncbi:MAG TPA: hypothetical protein VFM49_27235, partial [Chloroflexia bacterium]|nr:hypothetical protein [Chloroflexia bacterium]